MRMGVLRRVYKIDPDAAFYIRTKCKIKRFKCANNLSGLFIFRKAKQGLNYWGSICKQLDASGGGGWHNVSSK